MVFALKVTDETSSGDLIFSTVLEFPAELITVRQLIEARVAQEVDKMRLSNRALVEQHSPPVQPSIIENSLNGHKAQKVQGVCTEKQKRIAVNAFSSNEFFLLVNDQQLTSLDDQIVITPNSNVTFLKLIPLMGG